MQEERILNFVEKEPYEKGFAEYYRRYSKDFIELENERVRMYRRSRKALFFSIASIVLSLAMQATVVFLSTLSESFSDSIIPILCIEISIALAFIAVILFAYYSSCGPRDSYRKKYLPILLGFFQGFSANDQAKKSQGYEMTWKWKGIPIDVSRTWSLEVFFNGTFVRLPMRRKFSGKTVVVFDSLFNAALTYQGLRRTQLEANEFEGLFDVFTSDEAEARYLLPPDVMGYLIDIKKSFGGKLKCTFVDQYLYVAMTGKESWFLSGRLDRSLLDTETVHSILRQVHDIFCLVDLLDEDFLIARDEMASSKLQVYKK